MKEQTMKKSENMYRRDGRVCMIMFIAVLTSLSYVGPLCAAVYLDAAPEQVTDEAFSVKVVLDHAEDLYGAALDVIYDPEFLEVADVNADIEGIQPGIIEGDLLNREGRDVTLLQAALEDDTPGTLVIGITRSGDVIGVDVASDTTLLSISFVPKKAGETLILFSKQGLRDSEYDDIPADPWEGITLEIRETVSDTDGDGLSDTLEAQMCADPDDADTDNDGIPDGDEDRDQDGMVDDGETDPCDADTDADGIQDGTESGYTLADIGQDTDTDIFQEDADPETTTDPLAPDTDEDGLNDGEEDLNHNGRVDPGEPDPNDDQPICDAVAAFTADPLSGPAPLEVTFDTSGSKGAISFDYGDGQTGSDMTHTYVTVGTYSVTLTARTSDDCDDRTERTITVTEKVCHAVATFTAEVDEQTVIFDVTGSSGDFLFDYGDGHTGTALNHTYADEGLYEVTLWATDKANDCTDTKKLTVRTEKTYHSADYQPKDYDISLSELLRVQQLYIQGEYHCDDEGEDGYGIGLGDHNCTPHDSDYAPQDWEINLSEFLRLIQFYNLFGYHVDSNGEDGFGAGRE